MGRDKRSLSSVERAHLEFVRWTLRQSWVDTGLARLQEHVGARWIDWCTSRLRTAHGLEHIRPYRERSILLVSNHRSFFDMFVINAILYREGGFRQRFLFPVRANFFYDRPAGFAVNGIMSFFSMYPPVFRDRARASLNRNSFEELSHTMQAGLRSAGIHPEGTRNTGDDPYQLLPPQTGVGRLVHVSGSPVMPVFINGLQNDLRRQVVSNFRGDGTPIHVVFGPEVPLTDLRGQTGNGRIYRRITERIMAHIGQLGDVERQLRASPESGSAGRIPSRAPAPEAETAR
jgi:1-acyl-sn-glycerol-3-phosphate acyltransferase